MPPNPVTKNAGKPTPVNASNGAKQDDADRHRQRYALVGWQRKRENWLAPVSYARPRLTRKMNRDAAEAVCVYLTYNGGI